jgi:hemerythrin
LEEIRAAGIDEDRARKIFEIKKFFAYDNIVSPEEMIDQRIVGQKAEEIKNGVFIKRISFNKYRINYKDEHVEVDLNLGVLDTYKAPFNLPFHSYPNEYFTVIHTGEGNGWDVHRPCMASVIVFRDKIYVIDAGPNILNNLNHLGISVAEIDGIFQSHVHDDHFAGLTELIKADKRFKYYTSSLVRHTAQKKLSALMDFSEDSFHYVFECIDLELDEWNDIEGLEVKPVLSPHPVETNVFSFKVKANGQSKIYTHLSDTVGLSIFEDLINSRSHVFGQGDYDAISKAYLSKADLKKVDVGGGAIHGHLVDYREDKSSKIVFAHTDEHNINIPDQDETRFGSFDVLIHKKDNRYIEMRALKFLKHYFTNLVDEDLLHLLEGSLQVFKPGDTIITSQDDDKHLCLIVTGIIDAISPTHGQKNIPAGTFVGFSRRYFFGELPNSYEAASHVNALLVRESIMNEFIRSYSSELLVATRLKYIVFLRSLWIFAKSVSLAVLNKICGAIEEKHVADGYTEWSDDIEDLVILFEGEAVVSYGGRLIATLKRGDHFGASKIINRPIKHYEILIKKNSKLLQVPESIIKEIPSVLWKILEVNEKRDHSCSMNFD